MVELVTHPERSPDAVRAIRSLVAEVARTEGRRPVSDEHWLALGADGDEGAVVVTAWRGDDLVAFGQAVAGNDAHSVELVVRPDVGDPALAATVLGRTLDAVRAAGGGVVHFWISAPTDEEDALARSSGLAPSRRLLQMRRPLPTGLPVDVETRDFRPGQDEAAWLTVNNRAFADHPEQGAWTPETLALREAEPWFDPAGFRLHERNGRLAAFCWTKLHEDEDPRLGEIYVIAVDPDFQGLGLGRQLTLAGLESISRRGVDTGMLHVDQGNTAAVALYEGLGFEVHHVDVAYATDLRARR